MKRKRSTSTRGVCHCDGIRACARSFADEDGCLRHYASIRLASRQWRMFNGKWVASLQDLQRSAAFGCQSCHVQLTAVRGFGGDLSRLQRIRLRISSLVPQLRVTVEDNRDVPKIDFYLSHPSGYQGYEPFGPRVLQPPCQPRVASLVSNADDAVGRVEQWLLNCLVRHPSCQSGGFVPRRLLYVGGTHADIVQDPIRLIEARPRMSEPFLALSHCWGQTQHAVTTRANYSERLASIRIDELSKTFQDAVWLTRRLGIAYLWIDSLCIVQDDLEDWESEAANMPQLYMAAHLTIAAAQGVDGSAGILCEDEGDQRVLEVDQQLPNGQKTKATFVVAPRVKPRKSSKVHALYASDKTILEPSLTDRGLLSRGWAFQERALSTRIVHFTREELIWECKERRRCQCGGIDEAPFVTSLVASAQHRYKRRQRRWEGKDDDIDNDDDYAEDDDEDHDGGEESEGGVNGSRVLPSTQTDAPEAESVWSTFVKYYTTRSFTKLEDRGPAFRA